MKLYLSIIPLLLLPVLSSATDSLKPFDAECEEGGTHRYDGGNGRDMSGGKADFDYGWSTEKWGGLEVSWEGGKVIKVGNLEATVLSASNGVISAAWAGDNGLAHNIYSFVIDLPLGQAVYSQVHASSLGESRSIKVRSQDLTCAFK